MNAGTGAIPRLVALVAMSFGVFWIGASARAADQTINLEIRPYCGADDTCGHGTVENLRDFVLDAVQEMNLVWRPTGISFRPFIHPNDAGGVYNVIDGCPPGNPGMAAWRTIFGGDMLLSNPNVITLHIWEGRTWCCSNIPDSGEPSGERYGLFCDASLDRGVRGLGTLYAHEMGHHWCLSHTMTYSDFEQSQPSAPSHDNDFASGVEDTSPDPGPIEGFKESDPAPRDLDEFDNTRNDHEWCTPITWDENSIFPVDSGSPHPSWCGSNCVEKSGGITSFSGEVAPTQATMSYYSGKECQGPYVRLGNRVEGLTPDSVARIHWCRDNIPERSFADACPLGDSDSDGLCNTEDNCPRVANTAQRDGDLDTVGDACDDCPKHPDTAQTDSDGDGWGDACDWDLDGDMCANWNDDHPNDANPTTGTFFNIGCGNGGSTSTWEGSDSDGDGFRNCDDRDDDNDGICDRNETHPPDLLGDLGPDGCVPGPDACPVTFGEFSCHVLGDLAPCPPPWLACLGTTCVEFFLKVYELINPDPTTQIFDSFQIYNDTLFAIPQAGQALSEAALSIGGQSGPAAVSAVTVGGSLWRMEIWSRDPEQLVAVVGDFDVGLISHRDITRGRFLKLTPGTDAAGQPTLLVETSWGMGIAGVPGDADGDGLPDVADNCIQRSNGLQWDLNRNGIGDACEVDFDGDGITSEADGDAVAACVGTDMTVETPIAEPDDDLTLGLQSALDDLGPTQDQMAAKRACEGKDLDENRLIDSADLSIARLLLGESPGPAAGASVDTDGDGVIDRLDPCPLVPAPATCDCGDVSGDGSIDPNDSRAIRERLVGVGSLLAVPGQCNSVGIALPGDGAAIPPDCNMADVVVLRRAEAGKGPPITTTCNLPVWANPGAASPIAALPLDQSQPSVAPQLSEAMPAATREKPERRRPRHRAQRRRSP